MADIFNTPIYVCDVTLSDDSVVRYHFANKHVMLAFSENAETRSGVKRTLCDTIGYMIYGNSSDAINSLDHWNKSKEKD